MKKIVPLLLAACVLLLTACSSAPDDAPDKGTVQPGFDSAVGGDIQPAENEDDTADDENAAGSVNGGVYTSAFAGMGCALDDSWTFYTDEQIAQLNGLLTSQSSSEDVKTRLESTSGVYDMYAASTDGLLTINVAYQNLGLLGSDVTAQEYAELSSQQLPDALTSYGFTDVEAAVTSGDFAGHTACPAVAITAKLGDTTLYERMYCVKTGSYLYCVTLSSFTEDVTEAMAELFYGI